MQNQIYHSGLKLRALRELKGLKEKELAEALNCEYDSIIHWEGEGVPDKDLLAILDFFEVTKNMFSVEILSDAMLKKLAICELQRPALEKEFRDRLDTYTKSSSFALDLSSLGLLIVPDLIFTLTGIRKVDLSDNLLTEIPLGLQKFIDSGGELIIRNNFIDPKLPNSYNILDRMVNKRSVNTNLLIEKVRLTKLRLENIGIYKDITIDFNEDITVLIGVNGAGKTTILKALSLAILGARESVNSKAVSLRNIDIPITTVSRITLTATVNDKQYSNQINLSHNTDTGEIDVDGLPFEQLYNTPLALKNLILCLGEQRNNSTINPKHNLDNSPRILDLLPLLRGEDQSCILEFKSWWKNLENRKINQPNYQNTINLCFEVFSKFMGEEIQSAGLINVENTTELWVKYETGKLVPIDLASQGYQAVMGWVGFLIQRMIEANEDYPLPLSQPSIVIIDEIDQLLSVKWQQKILSILREFFPNTQWIISTHSPMVLNELDKYQVIKLHERDGHIVADHNEVDLWMWTYEDIIRRYFEISTTPPKFQEQVIVNQIDSVKKLEENSENNLQLISLQERLQKVRDSSAAVDKFEKQLQSLKNREQQLVDLMNELKSNSN
jgi:predicted ATP-binding protein involved in virulence/transcriptional regulator with XRE-family HTH domain